MSQRALDEAGRLLARRVGLRLDPAIRGRLARAVRDEAAHRDEDETAYVARLDADPARLQELLNRITVQETAFFRDPGHFTVLASRLLPPLRAEGRPVVVWSAGCANGQEPYSLAMVLAESGIGDWRVIASDVSTAALERTRAARYRERELRGLSPERRSRYLVRDEATGDWEIAPDLRDRVTTVRHNLASDPPPFPARTCQVVFCRNVLIYFGHDDVVAFLDRLADHLPASAHLFLGYSESLWQVSDRFHLIRLDATFAYQPASVGVRWSAPSTRPARLADSPPAAAPPLSAMRPVPEPVPAPAADPVRIAPPSVVELMAAGEAALDAGDHAGAAIAFRKAAFLDPDQPIAHLNLGLALEVGGDDDAARRAYSAARAALDRCDTAAVESTLEGYHLDDLVALLDRKMGRR